jgi:hypothetical protein
MSLPPPIMELTPEEMVHGRLAQITEIPEQLEIVSEATIDRLLALWDKQDALQAKRELPRGSRAEIIERAKAYAATEPPAISGQNGHGRCFHVACQLVIGFGLNEEEAFQAIQDWNARCEPPWSEKELRHKLKDADKAPGERGYLLGRTAQKRERKEPTPEVNGPDKPPEPERWDPPIPLEEAVPAAPFPLEVFPSGLQRFIEECAWSLNVPPDFIAVPMLVTAGAAIGNSRRLLITRTHSQGAVLFASIVGLASSGKSPAVEIVNEPLEEAQHRYFQHWKEEMQSWEPKSKSDPEPRPRQILVDDPTTESLVSLLQDNPRGLLMVRDEMAALVSGLNQYKENGGSDRQFYLKLWPQASIRVHRIRNKNIPVNVHRPFVGIVGGLQPTVIDAMRGASEQGKLPIEDGFIDRFLFSFPERLPAVGEQWREVSQEASNLWHATINRLLILEMDEHEGKKRPIYCHLSGSGRMAWKEFTERNAAELNDPDFAPNLVGPWGKLRGYCGRFALILHYLRCAAGTLDGDTVDGESMEKASALVSYFKNHARRVHQAIGADPRIENARTILRWLQDREETEISRREIWRGVRRRFHRPEDLAEPMKLLQHLGYVRWRQVKPSEPGRPFTPTFVINPYFYEPGDNGDINICVTS